MNTVKEMSKIAHKKGSFVIGWYVIGMAFNAIVMIMGLANTVSMSVLVGALGTGIFGTLVVLWCVAQDRIEQKEKKAAKKAKKAVKKANAALLQGIES